MNDGEAAGEIGKSWKKSGRKRDELTAGAAAVKRRPIFLPRLVFTFFMRVDGFHAFPSRDSFITQRGQVILAVDHLKVAPKKIRTGRGTSQSTVCYPKIS